MSFLRGVKSWMQNRKSAVLFLSSEKRSRLTRYLNDSIQARLITMKAEEFNAHNWTRPFGLWHT
ncbi:hypothetical protein BKA66DRAFT_467848 [Pyrenochaeta sp. MPI-SDFR-AT-0127]|nr:hypothetical protein BKA66DRAFT_467848 [Pyrenochaeta sp. MPI-SDFR-AT-0127]